MSQVWQASPLHQRLFFNKVKYKEYVKNVGEKEKNKDWVPDKYSKRAAADRVVKKALIS